MSKLQTRRAFIQRTAAVGSAAFSASVAITPLKLFAGEGKFRGRFAICNETFGDWAFDKAFAFAAEVAAKPEHEPFSRQASNALYHVMSAVLMAEEGSALAKTTGDARRLLLSRLVIDHRMRPRDPMSLQDGPVEIRCAELLLDDAPVSLEDASRALAG